MTGSGISVTQQALIALRKKALRPLPLAIKKKLSLAGPLLTLSRGRGIEFDATREYQPGDDIRNMAWRVTARSLKPYVKVYCEEKERPVWLALDLSPSLYFGTRCQFKSVTSITQATLTGWASLHKRERTGAVICATSTPKIYQPQASEQHYLSLLNAFAEASRLRPDFNEKHYLNDLLLSLQQHTRTGDVIHLYSDFLQYDAAMEKRLVYLSQRAHLVLNFVYDPFEAVPPPVGRYSLTNGWKEMLFNMQDAKNREQYRKQFQARLQHLKDIALKHRMLLRVHCTDVSREVPV